MKKTFVTNMPNQIGAFLKASKCFSELGINITRVSYNKAVDKELLTMLLRHIFLLINRYLKENGKSGIDALNDIERSIRYFNENYTKDINIDEYAKSLHVSTCWFNRRFKQVTKVTPLQYILSLRLSNAKMLLETNDYNVTETAYSVGFNNPLYFSRLFTKHIGMSPSEYKALHSGE